jgi:hypothetical protein
MQLGYFPLNLINVPYHKKPRIDIYSLILQIPNPLFDLAGITCGHFLVPFWTFFGATVIGKAIIKMHIQVSKRLSINVYFSRRDSINKYLY